MPNEPKNMNENACKLSLTKDNIQRVINNLTLVAKRLYRLSTVEQYIVKLVIRYYVFELVKVCRLCKYR